MEPDEQRHRVLGSPSRSRLLTELRRASGPLGVRDLATRVGLHANTVREHLEQLVAAGLVAQHRGAPAGRGRPAFAYRAEDEAPDDAPAYRALARVLADEVAAGPNPDDAAIRAGERWGAAVASALPARPSHPVERLVDLLDDLGFAPERDRLRPAEIRLHRCPFGSLARERSGVVCGAHLGLMRGALRELAAPADALALEPFVAPNLCVARLGTVEPSA